MPSFGSMIRGKRLGYGWSHRHGCFVRISGEGPPWEIRLAPDRGIPTGGTKGEYRCWWDNKDGEDVLDMIEPLRQVRGVKRPLMFFVDDNGQGASA